MHAYRFRILTDEAEDFIREVEVLASQTFQDFHEYLVKLFEFKTNELASFSICNTRWIRQCEITLIDMNFDENEDSDDDDDRGSRKKMKTVLMADSRINEYIEDPHQRIIYEYDYMNPRVFFLEMSKIVTAEPGLIYPICVKSEGSLPKRIRPMTPQEAGIETDPDLMDFEPDLADETYIGESEEELLGDIGDGFEIEEGGVEASGEEGFDSSFEEGQRI